MDEAKQAYQEKVQNITNLKKRIIKEEEVKEEEENINSATLNKNFANDANKTKNIQADELKERILSKFSASDFVPDHSVNS